MLSTISIHGVVAVSIHVDADVVAVRIRVKVDVVAVTIRVDVDVVAIRIRVDVDFIVGVFIPIIRLDVRRIIFVVLDQGYRYLR
jgi:hypothetical protein